MRARISIIGTDILCESERDEHASDSRIPLTDDMLTSLKGYTQQYENAVGLDDPSLISALGATMFDWLDKGGWASRWVKGSGDRVLEIAVDNPEDDTASALLDMPWETLARNGDFLAADPIQSFVVFRSIGRGADSKPARPAYSDLAIMFMAAAPEGLWELDFEAEEAAILKATERLPVQVVVEESGCADFLKDRLAQDGPFEVIHISCHGDIVTDVGPALAFETPVGDLALITPGDLSRALGERKPPFVFLSACRTAQSSVWSRAEAIEPFVRAMVRGGVPNIIGWDGSVYDDDAILFARTFYGELAEHASVPFAAATARRELLRSHRNDTQKGRHWHLARMYAGPSGPGLCCDRGLPKRQLRMDAGFREFLDKANERVPVATAQEFVGRRRQAQVVLSAFRRGGKAGVLIFGMGDLGKSSLAARIANRMPEHETVVVWQRYDALAIFEQLIAALPGSERKEWEQRWREEIASCGGALRDALEEMLEDPFDRRPILLIVDDLEQILQTPRPGQITTPVKDAPGNADAWRLSMLAVLSAFEAANTESRLLLTSRYDFSLRDSRGRDLANALERVQLHPMEANERAKQWRAADRTAGRAAAKNEELENSLVSRALAVAGGNPGLQEILCRPILSGEPEAAGIALDAVNLWKMSGKIPNEDNAAQEFFRKMAFEIYWNALTDAQRTHLRSATLFSEGFPVPVTALEVVGLASGISDPRQSLTRMIGLGLVDKWADKIGIEHAAVNPLARPLVRDKLTNAEQQHLATEAIAPLVKAWRKPGGDFPFDPRGVEAARLALMADAPANVLESAAFAAGVFWFSYRHNARATMQIMMPALAKIEEQGGSPRHQFLLLASNCAERIGEVGLQIELLEKGLALPSDEKNTFAQIALTHAKATIIRDGSEKAFAIMQNLASLFKDMGEERSYAVAMGHIADILRNKGEVDEALRIYTEEELPVYERIKDSRSRAITLGKIAGILWRRGKIEEALRIYTKEELPVYERLGDVRSRAITMGNIADILQQKGEIDEALRIRREEELPILERLGDVRERAATLSKIADILLDKGEIDEALRIQREEVLPAYKRMGDILSTAVVMGKIADILKERGNIDKALLIYTKEELPVYERLGQVRERAVSLGKIARILYERGEIDEALRMCRDEILPVYDRIGDVQGRAATMTQIAAVLQEHGKTDEALRICRDEILPLYKQIDDVGSQVVTMGHIANILEQRGEIDEALRIRREEQLPFYESSGDLPSWAKVKGKIADILKQKGEIDEAQRIWIEDCLPVAQKTGDTHGISQIRFACARLRLARGGLEHGEAEIILKELAESFHLLRGLQLPEGISVVGKLFGRILAVVGLRDEALTILDQSAAAYDQLKWVDGATEVRELQKRIREGTV
jgi:tetratricopeptide (TPR) repeat protein